MLRLLISSFSVPRLSWLSLLLIHRVVTNALEQNRVHPQVRGQELNLCGHCSHGNLPKETKSECVANDRRRRAHWEKVYLTRKGCEISTKPGSRNAVTHRPGSGDCSWWPGRTVHDWVSSSDQLPLDRARTVYWLCRWSPDGGAAHLPVNQLGWEHFFRSFSSFAPIFYSSSNLWICNSASWVNSGGQPCKCLLTLSLIKNSSMCPHHPQDQTLPSNF